MKILKRDYIWSYASQILSVGSGIFLLPYVLKYLENKDISLWYIFLTIQALLILLDGGLQSSLGRSVSFAYAGAKVLLKEGFEESPAEKTGPNYELLNLLFVAGKRTYAKLSIVTFLVVGFLSNWYLLSLGEKIDYGLTILPYTLFFTSLCISLGFGYFVPFLTGAGKIKEGQQALVISKVTFIAISVALLTYGFNLYAMACGNLVGVVAGRLFLFFKMRRGVFRGEKKPDKSDIKKTETVIFHNGIKMITVGIGSFLITKVALFFIFLFLDAQTAAEFGVSQQILNLIAYGSSIFLTTTYPKLSYLRISGDKKKFSDTIKLSLFLYLLLFTFGIVLMLLCSDLLFSFIKTKAKLIDTGYFLFYALIVFLEQNHSNAAGVILTGNKVPFVPSALISGIAVLGLLFVLHIVNAGSLLGVLLVQFIVQAAFNNWYWPYRLLKEMRP